MLVTNNYYDYEDLMATLAGTPLTQTVDRTADLVVDRTPMSGMNQPNHLGSTFIDRVRFLPLSQTAIVRIGTGNYLYPLTQTTLANWMKSKSLGQFYNNYIKLK